MSRVTTRVFEKALAFITLRLNEAKAQGLLEQYALIGGFAVSAWGIPRATHDVDFAIALKASSPLALSQYLKVDFHAGELDDPIRGVFQLSYPIENHYVPIQLILLPTQWTTMIIERVVELSILDCTIPVISWQVLILLKIYAGVPQDLLDAKQIMRARQPNPQDLDDIEKLATQGNLSDSWRSFTKSLAS